ncbi:hypothetical protein CLAIMM_01651 [Cladophialophora immunda]|nr:hypothetical protein CLAIMM_01651 [Cladophialophora immunda]
MKLITALGALCLFVSLSVADVENWSICPDGSNLCDAFFGAFCYAKKDTCCQDGSGICPAGYNCGTGVAANRCCPPGITMQQCAQVDVIGRASTVAADTTTRNPKSTKTTTKKPSKTSSKPKSTKATKTTSKAKKPSQTPFDPLAVLII